MKLLPSQRHAEEFARALDSGDIAVADDLAPAASALIAAAAAVRPVHPDPAFSAALRQRLVAVAAVQAAAATVEQERDWRSTLAAPRVQRRFAVMAGAAAGVVAFSGVGIAAESSLPGDPLYGVKRSVEAVQMATANGDLAEGTKHLQFAETRLREVGDLTERDLSLPSGGGVTAGSIAWGGSTSDRITSTLSDMDEETREGTQVLTRAYNDGHAVAFDRLQSFTERQAARLTALLPELPADARDEARASLRLLETVDVTVERMAEETPGTGSVEEPELTPAPEPAGTDTPAPVVSPAPGGPLPVPGSTTGPAPVPTPGGVPSVAPLPSKAPTVLPTLPINPSTIGGVLPSAGTGSLASPLATALPKLPLPSPSASYTLPLPPLP